MSLRARGIGREGCRGFVGKNLATGAGEILSGKLILLAGELLLVLCQSSLGGLARLPDTDGSQEGFEVDVQILGVDAQVPVEKKEQLLLHEVDFGDGKAKVVKAGDGTVPRPVLVLGRRVVEVLRGKNERSQEDAVGGAWHALGNRWQT